jgi:hypothetical protein
VAALMAVCEFQSFIWRFSRFGENNSKLIWGFMDSGGTVGIWVMN